MQQKEVPNSWAKREIVIGGVSDTERLILVEHLYAGVRSGYSIIGVLQLAHSQARGRLKQILSQVITDVENGAYLYESFGKYPKYFPPTFFHLLKVGELSASLEGSLKQLHTLLQKDQEFSQKIRSASIYPMFVLIAVFGLGLSVSYFVLPTLVPLFKSINTELPASTKLLLWFADAFDRHGNSILLGFLLLIIFWSWFVRRNFSKPFTHWLILRIPLLGHLYRKILLMHFGRTMHSLLKSGITIDTALENAAGTMPNIYYQRALTTVIPQIGKGDSLTNSLRNEPFLFDSLFTDMLSLGEKTGSLEESFLNVTEFYELEVNRKTKDLITALEPLLLIVVGIVVGFVAISILGPIYSLSGNIR